MARGNKCKAAEGHRSEKRKKRAVDQLENRNCSEEGVEASVRDEPEEIDPLEARIDEEALIFPHCARFVLAKRYDLATILDDVGSFPAKIFIRSRLKMFNEFKQVVVDQCLKSRFKNSYFGGLWDLPEHMKFNGQLVHYTLLRRVKPYNKLHEMWFNINDRPACFGLKEFALITGLNCGRYPRDSRYVKAMEEGKAFFKKIMKKRSVNAKRLLKFIRGGRLDKEDKFKCCLVWFVHCIFLAWDLSKTADIDTIKMVDYLGFFEKYPWGKESFSLTLDYLKKRIDFSRQKKTFETKGVSSGTSKSTEDPLPISRLLRWNTSKGDKLIEGDPYLNGWSTKRVHPYLIPTVHKMKHHYMKKFKALTDKPNDAFIDGLKACLEGVTVITSSEDGEDGDEDRDLGGNSVSKHVTRGVQVQSRHSATRAGCNDSGIKEALLEVAALEYAFINADEVMIPEVAAVIEKENLNEGDEEKEEEKNEEVVCEEENKADGSAGVEKEDHDEGRQDEDDKKKWL
ncbi:hypothetical protein FXO38_13985 [Capsicum annuum]|nr:hypothetical protein FXO38_13985 [Capsicum annuum]